MSSTEGHRGNGELHKQVRFPLTSSTPKARGSASMNCINSLILTGLSVSAAPSSSTAPDGNSWKTSTMGCSKQLAALSETTLVQASPPQQARSS